MDKLKTKVRLTPGPSPIHSCHVYGFMNPRTGDHVSLIWVLFNATICMTNHFLISVLCLVFKSLYIVPWQIDCWLNAPDSVLETEVSDYSTGQVEQWQQQFKLPYAAH